MLERAARVKDPINHTYAELGSYMGSSVGIGLGILVCVLAWADPPDAISIAADIASGVKELGQFIGSKVSAGKTGEIKDGAATVFTGEGQPEAARMSDPVQCSGPAGVDAALIVMTALNPVTALLLAGKQLAGSAHDGATIADGSDCVFIERWNASRKTEKTSCAGEIADGCPTVLIGGESIARMGMADINESPGWLNATMDVIAIGGAIVGVFSPKGVLGRILAGVGALSKVMEKADPDRAGFWKIFGNSAGIVAELLNPKELIKNPKEALKKAGLYTNPTGIGIELVKDDKPRRAYGDKPKPAEKNEDE